MPAVILVELLAQTGGIAVAAPPPGEPGRRDRAPRRGDRALQVSRRPPVPGATLEARARVAGRLGGLFKIEGTVTADGVLVASGSLTLAGRVTVRRPSGSGFVGVFQ